MESIDVTRRDAMRIINATFRGYMGRKVRICPTVAVTLHDLNWGGGSRNQYRACTLQGATIESRVDLNSPAPWSNQHEGQRIEIPRGACIVEHSIFCGKDMGLRIHVHPEDLAKLLPAPHRQTDKAHGINYGQQPLDV